MSQVTSKSTRFLQQQILSALSTVNQVNSAPMVLMTTIPASQLEKILWYAYTGRVSIAHSQLEEFSKSFNLLQMKGGIIDEQHQQDAGYGSKDPLDVSQQSSIVDIDDKTPPTLKFASTSKKNQLVARNPRTPQTSTRCMQPSKRFATSTPSRAKCPLCNKELSKSYIGMHMKKVHNDETVHED